MNKLAFLLFGIFTTIPLSGAWAGTAIPLTVNMSETVTVTGTPRIAVDVGGQTRYATYTSGSGTNALTFTLSPQAGDVDLDGVIMSSPIDLNGGTIKDVGGNNLASLAFTPPNTSGIKVNYPSLGMDFVYDADGRYSQNGTIYNDLTSFLAATGGTFTRASIGTYYDSTGTLQTAASGVPRFDYDPATHAAKGILIEETRTNLALQSDNFASASWGKVSATVSSNVSSAPDGQATADKLIAAAATSQHYLSMGGLASGTQYTVSIYAKAGEENLFAIDFSYNSGGAIFNLATGTVASTSFGSAAIQNIGNGWYRCSITGTPTSATSVLFQLRGYALSYAGDGASGLYIWGAQIEAGAFPTSYIPTTTATTTRAADLLYVPIGAWFNIVEGTLAGEAKSYNAPAVAMAGSSPTFAAIRSTGTINIARLGRYISTPSQGFYQSSGAGVSILNLGTWGNDSEAKLVGSYGSTGFSARMDNNAMYTNPPLALGTGYTRLDIGQVSSSGYWSSTIAKIRYYPTRIPDTQLQLLTQ